MTKRPRHRDRGSWQFTISERVVIIVTDQLNNRMRIISPVSKADGIPPELMKRLMQANFDTALDARYAIARGVIWATFIHPLRALHDRQFISGHRPDRQSRDHVRHNVLVGRDEAMVAVTAATSSASS